MKEKYKDINFRKSSLDRLEQINGIIQEYEKDGYDLSLRQLYYQLVSRGHIENAEKSYKSLISLVTDGRMAGLIDWDAITDRTRVLREERLDYHGENVVNIKREVTAALTRAIDGSFSSSVWARQLYYVECWAEKQAVEEIVERAAQQVYIPYFSARGYASATAMHEAAERFIRWRDEEDKECVLIYVGDHDCSGLDMDRDIGERLEMFGATVEIRRIALTLDQVHENNLPPNPGKETDSRFPEYQRKYGAHTWELDALSPRTLHSLIVEAVGEYYCDDIWDENQREKEEHIAAMREKYQPILEKIGEAAS